MTDRSGAVAGVGLILVAAGRGTRLGAGRPKALVPLGAGADAAPIVVHALRSALRCRALTQVVVVAPPDPAGMAQLAAALDAAFPGECPVGVKVVPGGAERSASVALGLSALASEVGIVLVHDAARALTPPDVFDRVVEAVRSGEAAVTPALPVTDTVKQVEVDADGTESVRSTLDRATLRAVQTPQGFRRETLERAHTRGSYAATDDCGMVEALGEQVHVVPGHPRAMKITTAHDLEVAAGWLAEPEEAVGAGAAADAGAVAPVEADAGAPAEADGARPGTLVVLSGAPGVGKTTLARAVCRRVGAAHVRVDTIEQGLVRGGLPAEDLVTQGYGAAYEVAADQLVVGLPVVADMVNGVAEARQAWEELAERTGARVVRVLVGCSDVDEHRRRVTGRAADIAGHVLPDWQTSRSREVEQWPDADLRVDTCAVSAEDAAARVVALVRDRMGR